MTNDDPSQAPRLTFQMFGVLHNLSPHEDNGFPEIDNPRRVILRALLAYAIEKLDAQEIVEQARRTAALGGAVTAALTHEGVRDKVRAHLAEDVEADIAKRFRKLNIDAVTVIGEGGPAAGNAYYFPTRPIRDNPQA